MPKIYECFTEIAVLIEADTPEEAKAAFLDYIKTGLIEKDVEADEITIQ